jgi:uncharacterized membrane protein YeaQ/YmgE (transglycosylase-associated protein family)
MGILWNVIVGIIGALLGNVIADALFDTGGTIQTFNLTGFIIAVLGAIVLLGIVNLVQRGRVR